MPCGVDNLDTHLDFSFVLVLFLCWWEYWSGITFFDDSMATNKTCAECSLLEVLAIDNGVTFYTCPYAEPEDACVVSPAWPACNHMEE